MNINIYEDYKIMIHNFSSLLSEENKSIYDNIFVENENTEIKIINGGKLIDIISKLLNDNYISEFTIVNKTFIFEYFNYHTGENWIKHFTILEDKGSDNNGIKK